jgi:hypothetical protein
MAEEALEWAAEVWVSAMRGWATVLALAEGSEPAMQAGAQE